jgi:hypothetical protein
MAIDRHARILSAADPEIAEELETADLRPARGLARTRAESEWE